MATNVPTMHPHDLTYEDLLYRRVMQRFVKHMPAVQLTECEAISTKLTNAEMELVQVADSTGGRQSSARKLLDLLQTKLNWFEAFLTALREPSLKLGEFVEVFVGIKESVDEEFRRIRQQNKAAKGQGSHLLICNSQSITEYAEDGVEDSSAERILDPDSAMPKQVSDCYEEATSSQDTYSSLNKSNTEEEHTYEAAGRLERDALPELSNPVSAANNTACSTNFPCEQDNHPSLRSAISRKPHKNFDRESVCRALEHVHGWSPRTEEQEVLRALSPYQHLNGVFIIWYWSLAQRPTICITYNNEIKTFIVHKKVRSRRSHRSTEASVNLGTGASSTFYYLHRDKMMVSLEELVFHYVREGIEDKPTRSTIQNATKIQLQKALSDLEKDKS